ncbi:MAG: hypothetical protein ACRDGR_00215 [bacterium]
MTTSGSFTLVAKRAIPVLGLLTAVSVYLFHTLRYLDLIGPYLIDDAFIFFRYADNFARGHGLVYNPGEPVEGYTSPLWALGLGIAARAGLPLIETAQWSGIVLGVLTLLMAHDVAQRLFRGTPLALLPALFLATNRTFCVWSVEGLDTKLFGAAVLAVLWIRVRHESGAPLARRAPLLGVACAIAVLSRPEGALFAALLAVLEVGPAARERRTLDALANVAAFVVIVASHLAFRWMTYHELLPNTFYAKVAGVEVGDGLRYLADVARGNNVAWYGLLTAVGAYSFLRCEADAPAPAQRWIVLTTSAFLAYAVAIGGDFFEFRFLDPILPLWAFMTVRGLEWIGARLRRRTAASIAVGALATSWIALNVQTIVGPISGDGQVVTTPERARQGTRTFARIGRWLALNLEPDDVISVHAAGVIPYLARLRNVDPLGLNDREIARNPDFVVRGAPGHRRRVPEDYLRRRGVTYVVGSRLNRQDSPLGEEWITAEVEPGLFFHIHRLRTDAGLSPGVHRLGEHRGSLEGWDPVERPSSPPPDRGGPAAP